MTWTMLGRASALALFAGTLAVAGCDQKPKDTPTPTTEVTAPSAVEVAAGEIDAVGAAWAAAYNGSDAAGIAALYGADAQFWPTGEAIVNGGEAIAASYAAAMAAGTKVTIDVLATSVAGDIGLSRGVATLTGPNAEGQTVTQAVRYALMLKKTDGAWKIHRQFDTPAPDVTAPGAEVLNGAETKTDISGPTTLGAIDPVANQATIDAWVAAVKSGDAAQLAALYEPDVLLISMAGELTGADNAAQALVGGFTGAPTDASVAQAEAIYVTDNVTVSLGTATVTGTPAEGAPAAPPSLRYLTVSRKGDDGKWRIWRGITQPTAP